MKEFLCTAGVILLAMASAKAMHALGDRRWNMQERTTVTRLAIERVHAARQSLPTSQSWSTDFRSGEE